MFYATIVDLSSSVFQWSTLPLVDNIIGAQYAYEVHVYTGFQKHSDTDSNVRLTIVGEHGDTGVRWLADGERKVNTTFHDLPNTINIYICNS